MAKTATKVPSDTFNMEFEQGSVKNAVAESGVKATDILMVPIDRIVVVSDFNVRLPGAALESRIEAIKASILANGFYRHCPLKGYVASENGQDLFYLTGGFTRFEAAKRAVVAGAPIETLPMVIVPAGTNMLDLMIAIDQDNTSERLAPFERAILVKRATNYGGTEEEIASRMGISGQYTKDLLFAVGLPDKLRQMMISGKASLGTVVQTARKYGANKAIEMMTAAPLAATTPSKTPAATTGTGRKAPTPPTAEQRLTAKRLRDAAGLFEPNKKKLRAAIMYAVDMVTDKDGIDWLRRWIGGDAEAVKELNGTLRKAAKSAGTTPTPPVVTRGARKGAAGKKNGSGKKGAQAGSPTNGKGKPDPLDIDTAATVSSVGQTAAPPPGIETDNDPL